MSRKVKQFRYYADGSSKNLPVYSASTLLKEKLRSGSLFNDYTPIVQLGIQGLPGTQFYLNNSTEPIIVGSTGIYELELSGETEISAINFSLNSLEAINKNDNSYLIVDLIYKEDSE